MFDKSKKEKIKLGLDIFSALIGLIALVLFFLLLGFNTTTYQINTISIIILIIVISYILQEIIRLFYLWEFLKYLSKRLVEAIILVFMFITLIHPELINNIIISLNPKILGQNLIYYNNLSILSIIIIALMIKALRYNHLLAEVKLHPGAIFAMSFAFIISTGSLLLLLPNSTPDGVSISFIDSLFTSTSAVCVTGLVVVDTAKHFTLLGQLFILFLIQVGGLGVMTLTTFFAMYLSGGESYKMKIMMKDLLSQESMSDARKLIKKILLFTFLIESVGTVSLYYSLCGFSVFRWDYIYSSIFHSVSAFCNAGFSIYSMNLMESTIQSNYLFPGTIMFLIILGGLGFAVLSNIADLRIRKNKFRKLKHRLSVSTKIVILTTLALIFGGALLFYLTEQFGFQPYLATFDKFFHALFQSVTARTAGYNTLPIEKISSAAAIVLIFLMWVGASPGSTGGGIKTSTFTITLLSLFNLMRGKDKVEVFNREILPATIKKAFMIIFSSLIFLGIGSFLLICIEPDKAPLDLIFEATSALGTVGLSRNITPFLGTGGKAVIITLMFIGRIGVLTFFLAFVRSVVQPKYSYAKTDVMIG